MAKGSSGGKRGGSAGGGGEENNFDIPNLSKIPFTQDQELKLKETLKTNNFKGKDDFFINENLTTREDGKRVPSLYKIEGFGQTKKGFVTVFIKQQSLDSQGFKVTKPEEHSIMLLKSENGAKKITKAEANKRLKKIEKQPFKEVKPETKKPKIDYKKELAKARAEFRRLSDRGLELNDKGKSGTMAKAYINQKKDLLRSRIEDLKNRI